VRLGGLNLVDYRNFETVRLRFESRRNLFLGPNGQGKTNLLEAIGLSSALRSFRTSEMRDLIRWDRPRAELLFCFEGSDGGETETFVGLNRTGGKEVSVDGDKVVRFGDFIGRFPSVVFCSEDLRLPRGSPGKRRKFLDMAFSSSDGEYLEALRRYHRALRERNALLRQDGMDAELEAFENEMSSAGAILVNGRREGLAALGDHFARRYQMIGGGAEDPVLHYLPDAEFETVEDFARLLGESRTRDRLVKTTHRGPHRDDFTFFLNDHDARKFASEGQQRSIVLALRFGQTDFLLERRGVRPLVLIDDVLGELDSERRANFRSCLDEESQVFATSTETFSEDADEWETFKANDGRFSKL